MAKINGQDVKNTESIKSRTPLTHAIVRPEWLEKCMVSPDFDGVNC